MSTHESNSFKENYGILKGVVSEMNNMEEPDVDLLIPMVEKGTAAYKNCISRCNQVEQLIEDMSKNGEQLD